MVSFNKRRKRKLTVALVFFLFVAVVPTSLYRFWRPEPNFLIFTVVGLTGFISSILFFYGRRRGAFGLVLLGLLAGAGIFLFNQNGLPRPDLTLDPTETATIEIAEDTLQLTVRVFDAESSPVDNAQVLIFHNGPPASQYSDSNGVVVFNSNENALNARLVIKHPDHDIREEEVMVTSSQRIDIQLSRKDESQGTVITYVVDNENGRPLSGAMVTIIAEGNIFQDTTDDTGLSRFQLDFPTGQLDVELNVSTDDYNTTNRSLTLRPNDVQNVRLNAEEEAIVVAEAIAVPEDPSISTSFNSTATSATFGSAVNAVAEEEPNDTRDGAQTLAEIGMESPIQATIVAAANEGEAGDEDWYEFTAVVDQTYVIELFNVANNIDLATSRYNCDGLQTLTGLRIIIYDPAGNEVDRVCQPDGRGNVHTFVSFVAGTTGNYTVQIAAHSPQVFGDYSLRILPKFDDDAAKWDRATFEPNNTLANAFAITPGYENALTGVIEPRQARYSTSKGDVDVFRFSAVAGQSYVVELFNVASNLTLQSNRYACAGSLGTYAGLWLGIYDPGLNLVNQQCTPNGVGNVHTILSFTAGSSGEHYIRLTPHQGTVSGNYSIRVLPKHGQPGAGWDEITFEPNNRAANGYALVVDAPPIRSRIEAASNVYSTTRSDVDWYRFEVVSGSSYIIELLDIDAGISASSARYACGGSLSTYNGFWLGVYDDAVTEVNIQCSPNGQGNIHAFIEFTASRNGTFYALVYPHDAAAAGEYSIAIRQK